MDQSPQTKELIESLKRKEKLLAMLAPSFPIVFPYPQIVGKIKRLGFKYVVEVSRGAKETNKQLLNLLKQNQKSRFITSPCPSIVRLIKTKYPELNKFLSPIDSPIIATAKIIEKEYPKFRPVFIGPCPVKKLEASQDHPELNILVLTYKELISVFDELKLEDSPNDKLASFDLVGETTRLYPISGGLADSIRLNHLLTDEEYDVVSGIKNVEKSLKEFPTNRVRVLDILFCDGGCISGLGIPSSLPLSGRREKVINFWQMHEVS